MPAGDNADGVRRRNLAAILDLVHHGHAASRAELTARTGLNRSTVAALVAELAELGLVEEGEPVAHGGVGRPSPAVRLAADGPRVLALNPEVDAVTGALVGLGGRVLGRVRVPFEGIPGTSDAVEAIRDIARRLGGPRGTGIQAMGLAIPGLVRAADGVVRWAPHLGWRDVPFTDLVDPGLLGYPVLADNDASLGAIAEHLFGAGRGVDDLVYLNGGASGIGGGVIVRGAPLTGRGGYAGEFGQNRPGGGDRLSSTGTLEDEVHRSRVLELLGLHDADEPALAAAISASDDPRVERELARQRDILAVALGNAINVFNPERVVLGGYLATLLDRGGLIEAVAQNSIPAAVEGVEIVPAGLGEDRLLIGAAELAFGALLRDPASIRP
jgi:predicted NBD/HSP70 family sugar kinase